MASPVSGVNKGQGAAAFFLGQACRAMRSGVMAHVGDEPANTICAAAATVHYASVKLLYPFHFALACEANSVYAYLR
jgi:hypothetical protein